jgi:hypothetical protein
MDQSIYIYRIIAKFGYENCSPVSRPADLNVHLDNTLTDHPNPTYSYSAVVDSLQFPQMVSRPNLSYAVNNVAKFSSNSQHQHYLAVGHILFFECLFFFEQPWAAFSCT